MRQCICWSLGLVLSLTQLAGCQKRVLFNPALAGRFFPLRSALTWTYQVTYANGGRETISDHVVNVNQSEGSHTALLVSDYSGFDGSRAIRADLPQIHPAEMAQVETRYIVEGGFITRVENLGGHGQIRLEERHFIPQYLWPDRNWSSTLSPFKHSPLDGMLEISQDHHTFLEADLVIVPAGHFSQCIRIETEATYHGLAGIAQKRYFTDWYAPDVGLVKTLVLSGDQDRREIARIELLRFAELQNASTLYPSNDQVPLGSKSANPSAPPALSPADR